MLLILHADHEQNCSTSTVRLVGSSHANLFASVSGGINALWGPLHGGANQAVLEMLDRSRGRRRVATFIERGQEQGGRREADGLRPPRLQELRPAREDRQEAADDVLASSASRIRCSTSRQELEEIALPTTTSSSASSTRTSTSTPGS
jgi:citrate synthase